VPDSVAPATEEGEDDRGRGGRREGGHRGEKWRLAWRGVKKRLE